MHKKSSLPAWGGIILALSFVFGFYAFMNANFSGPTSNIQIGDVNSTIAFFAFTLLLGILGATLIICGTIKNTSLSEPEKHSKTEQTH